jgi:hypothetical protein
VNGPGIRGRIREVIHTQIIIIIFSSSSRRASAASRARARVSLLD